MITLVTRDHLGDDAKWFCNEDAELEDSLSLFVYIADAATSQKEVTAIVTFAGSSPEESESYATTSQAG